MSNETQTLSSPGGRAIAVFDSSDAGEVARHALIENGVDQAEIYVLSGPDAADDVDTSAKWFADTDDLLERYQEKLRTGSTLVSAPVDDNLKEIQTIYHKAGAHSMTNFGSLVTRTINLDQPQTEEPIE